MSIIFEPHGGMFKINENCYNSKCNSYIDYYYIHINKENDIKTLSILNEETQNKNGKITLKHRNGNVYEIIYKNNEKTKIVNLHDLEYFCYDTQLQNIDSICIEIYKKYIEKYILLRANRMPNIDYLFDIYIMTNNNQCEKICENFSKIYCELLNCANIRLHFMYVKIEETGYLYDYTKSCSMC
jgi:hypothetical protein